MKTSIKAIDVIKKYESFEPCPYLDAAGIPTIGYGTTYYPNGKKVTMDDEEISKETAFYLLSIIIEQFEKEVLKYVKKELTQNQFDAIVIFIYNVGGGNFKNSTLLKRINENTLHTDIPTEFLRWNKAGGKVLRGLVKRRLEEANIYYNGYN